MYKKQKNKCTNLIRTSKSNYNKKLLSENANNPKKFWKCIKNIIPLGSTSKSSSSVPFVHSPLEKETVSASKVQVFCNFFANIARSLKQKSIPLKDFTWQVPKFMRLRTTGSFKFDYVSKVSIENQLNKLKENKTCGIDNLPTRLLKDSATVISQPLAYLINLSLQTSTIPQEWKTARVTPLHKSGDTTNTDNYRPISVLPILSKVLERAVHSQIMEYLESHGLLSKNQFGYRKKRSTELATTLFLDNIRRKIDKGKLVGALFIDLSKAFDNIGHSVLLSKLPAYGIKSKELEWFENYLFDRKQIVQYDGATSQSQPLYCCVPQGSIIGPLLFLL